MTTSDRGTRAIAPGGSTRVSVTSESGTGRRARRRDGRRRGQRIAIPTAASHESPHARTKAARRERFPTMRATLSGVGSDCTQTRGRKKTRKRKRKRKKRQRSKRRVTAFPNRERTSRLPFHAILLNQQGQSSLQRTEVRAEDRKRAISELSRPLRKTLSETTLWPRF